MKFGLSFLPDARSKDLSAAEYYQSALKLSIFADQHDFHYIKMTEHYLHPYGGYCPDPLTFLASVASTTKRIRLITGCILPAFHHPVQIAAQAAMVDCISQGRLDIGFARAYLPHEFDTFNIPLDESRVRYEESILAIRRLWTESDVSVDTPFFKFNGANSLPEPYQKPHPPIWGAAVNARQSFAWLAEHGFNLLLTPPLSSWDDWCDKLRMYVEIYKESNPEIALPNIALSLPLLIDHSCDEAQASATSYLEHYLEIWTDAAQQWMYRDSSNYPGYQAIVNVLRQTTPSSMIANRQAIIGDPKQVCREIEKICELGVIDTILWQIDFGAQSYTRSAKTLSLFVKQVMPIIGQKKCMTA